MKVLGLISSLTDPSSRARIVQYRDFMKQEDIFIKPHYFLPHTYADPAPWAYRLNKITRINPWRFSLLQKSVSRIPLLFQQYNYDLVWQNRMVIPHNAFYERNFKKPVVFDFDDAIWLHDGEKSVATAITRATMIFAGNEYLADYARKHNSNIALIPSVIDTTKLFPLPVTSDRFTIGWIGSVSNIRFLEYVKPAILEFLEKYKDARFLVVSSESPAMFKVDNDRVVFKKWSAEKENELINEFSIGLMPLADNDFTRGKCSYKMLQYMACGKPVVVSPVGTNKKILSESKVGLGATTQEEWFNAFELLKNDVDFYGSCAENGRVLVEKNYSVSTYCPVIARHFKNLLNKSV